MQIEDSTRPDLSRTFVSVVGPHVLTNVSSGDEGFSQSKYDSNIKAKRQLVG